MTDIQTEKSKASTNREYNKTLGRLKATFNVQQYLVDYLVEKGKFIPRTVRKIIYDFAEINNNPQRFRENAGKYWIDCF